jgi:hypothetical protein
MKTKVKSAIFQPVKLVLFIASICFAPFLFSQEDIEEEMEQKGEKHEKIEQMKIAFLSSKLELTSAEAEKFWPVYNEMSKKMKELKKDKREIGKELKEKQTSLKDEEIKKKTLEIFDLENKEVAIKKEYYEKFCSNIGARKASKLIYLENEFRRELLKKLNEEKGKKPAGKGK